MNFEDYAINVSPLPVEDGGGFMASIPDLPGCIADGATIDEAIAEARDAFDAWVMAEREDRGSLPEAEDLQRAIPATDPEDPPHAIGAPSGQRGRQPEPARRDVSR